MPAPEEATAWVSRGSDWNVYHLIPSCAGRSPREITVEEAKEEGLRPCPSCGDSSTV